jgi:type IV secretory pathway VirD2 relaxase
MAKSTRDSDEHFRVRPRPPKARGDGTFVPRVLTQMSRVGPGLHRRANASHDHVISRGGVAARFAGSGLNFRSRRVVTKCRLVLLTPATSRTVSAHLRYITRDGVTRDGQPGVAYDAKHDDASLRAFEARGRSDRHQFRFIVAPDDAVELDDLRSFTRALMTRMEADLGTPLDWVAVDHWDTDNPHTHLVVRGRHQAGHDLVIAREYLTTGMRLRACEVATEWLGPRTELEIRQGLLREVAQERWTSLDQGLQARSADGVIDLARPAAGPVEDARRSLLIGRLQRLEKMGLARALGPARWQLRVDAEPTLRALGERGDIVRTMQRAFAAQPREFTVFNPGTPGQAVVERVAGKGIADELQDLGYAILDATDGRAYYVRLPAGFDLEELPQGAIVQVRAAVDRAADRNVVALAQAGVYRTDHHLAQLKGAPGAGIDPVAIVTGHVRRLEALRRAGHVERIAEGVWRVPHDLVERGRAYDRTRLSGGSVEVLSHLPLERQIRAVGATWLDQQLIDDRFPTGRIGFAGAVHEALRRGRNSWWSRASHNARVSASTAAHRAFIAVPSRWSAAASPCSTMGSGSACSSFGGALSSPKTPCSEPASKEWPAGAQRRSGVLKQAVVAARGAVGSTRPEPACGDVLVVWPVYPGLLTITKKAPLAMRGAL